MERVAVKVIADSARAASYTLEPVLPTAEHSQILIKYNDQTFGFWAFHSPRSDGSDAQGAPMCLLVLLVK